MKLLTIDRLIDELLYGLEPHRVSEYVQLMREWFISEGVNPDDYVTLYSYAVKHPKTFGIEGEPDIPRTADTIIKLVYFLENGRHVFAPSEDLTIALLNTNFLNLSPRDLNLPARCIYLLVPERSFIFPYPASGEEDWLEGVIIYLTSDVLSLTFISEARIGEQDFFFATDGLTIRFSDEDRKHLFKDLWPGIRAALVDDERKIDILALVINFILFYTLFPNLAQSLVDEEYIELHKRLSQVRSEAKRRKLQSRLERTSPSHIRHLKPNKRYVWKLAADTKQRQKSQALNSASGRRAMRLHIVTGHFRNQPYGPRHSLRKIIWIEPFWRGKQPVDSDNIIVVR